jgi:hypothetical protein
MKHLMRVSAHLLLVLPIAVVTTSCAQSIRGNAVAVAGAPRPSATSSSAPSSSAGRFDLASLEGVWEGDYTCGQGKTGLRLEIGAVEGDTLSTTFTFSPLAKNPTAASGSFSMIGTETGGKLVFKQDKWMNQPDGYSMVDLEVSDPPQGGTLSGVVIGGSCSDFSVHKTS